MNEWPDTAIVDGQGCEVLITARTLEIEGYMDGDARRWAVARCWFCAREPRNAPNCVASEVQPWSGGVDDMVRVLSRKGLLRTVRR